MLSPRGDLVVQPFDEVLALVHAVHAEELTAVLGEAIHTAQI